MMYHCWKEHHILPSAIHDMTEGERTVLQAFFSKEMDERSEKNNAMQEAAKNGFFCPSMFG